MLGAGALAGAVAAGLPRDVCSILAVHSILEVHRHFWGESRLRTIAVEEHYATPMFLMGPGRELTALMDAAAELDAGEALAVARDANDRDGAAMRRHPGRFHGFAALPTAAPHAAADELERTVTEHGFAGALINGHTRGRYLDDPSFEPIFERAAALGRPIYLHPTVPPRPVVDACYAGNYSPAAAAGLATAAWGWHVDTGTHVLRLVLGGVFDRHPRLQLIVGHLGETLPFMLPRIEAALPVELTRLERPLGAYLRENLHYTISGFTWVPAFLDLVLQVGTDRIMFSTDHPYQPMARSREFLDALPVSPADRTRIAGGNAERLLRI
jgi:uncharacterized protein